MYLARPSVNSIVTALGREGEASNLLCLILLAEKSRAEIPGLIRGLNKNHINFCGGIFPGVIFDDQLYDEGAVIVKLPVLDNPFLIKELDSPDFILPDLVRNLTLSPRKTNTAIILVDGWASFICLFLSEIFNQLGNSFRYFGAGAGSLSSKNRACLFTPAGEFNSAAIVIFTALESTFGVSHGWKRLSGPFVATNTNNHIIRELNWAPALEVYLDSLELQLGEEVILEDFYRFGMNYPFGIYKKGSEDVVRNPIAVDKKGNLVCVGEVPENTALYILKGEEKSLLRAAGRASRDCLKRRRKEADLCLVADCASRSLFLGDGFKKELKTVKSIIGPCIPHGMLSIGEIASHGDAYLQFFNKTIVVGLFYG